MKIAIIGGGWVGCHLAKKLKTEHKVDLFSNGNELFSGTSFTNQNRLHLGFHYARNFKTRELCKTTFDAFLYEYESLVTKVDRNIYSVPLYKSNIDYKTYIKIFDDYNFQEIETSWLTDTDGSIIVGERYINPLLSKQFFSEELKDVFKKECIDGEKLNVLSKEYDLVINSTNNTLQPNVNNSFWESCVMLLYKKCNDVEFDALTLVDGELFSIYPYKDDVCSVSHVTYTPFSKHETPPKLGRCFDVNDVRVKMESRILEHYKDFNKNFEYQDYVLSVKSKTKDKSDNRAPTITVDGNIISCFTGKIQGIFQIENFVKNEILNRK